MNKNLSYSIKGVIGCLILTSLTTGCLREEGDIIPGGGATTPASSYVSLSFITPPQVSTKANPNGGENGDGTEAGQDYENAITSVAAFFYKGNVNSEGTTRVLATATFNTVHYTTGATGIDRVYTTAAQQINLDNGEYNVIVVANPGSDWWSNRTLTLADVRDHIQTQAWTTTGTEYSDFVMTSAGDATLTLASNPENDPAKVTVNVERMAARLDYQAQASYTCTDEQYPGAIVEITGAALVNNLTAGSYLIKRVADDVNGTNLSYLGDETPESGIQTNYVIDPWTAAKTANNNSFTVNGVAEQPASALYGTWFGNKSDDPNWWAGYVQPGTAVTSGGETWQRIGYTLENTTAAGETGSRYNTGVVFKAKFHPQGVANYRDRSTFLALGNHIFASMEDMMTYVYGADFTQFDNKIDACASWTDLKTFAASLLDNDPSGYKAFLQGQSETQDFTAAVKESLKWKAYMLNKCGYSASMDGANYAVNLDQNGIITRNTLQPFGVRTYEDATCYYTWWVRHSNDNNDNSNGIMEYAIVRNNIYKLTVTSIYSLGDEVPGEDKNIILDVYVNDWLLLDPETLPM